MSNLSPINAVRCRVVTSANAQHQAQLSTDSLNWIAIGPPRREIDDARADCARLLHWTSEVPITGETVWLPA